MALENITGVLASTSPDLPGQIKALITILQALGGVIIVYIVFNIINAVINRHRNAEIRRINKNLEDIKKLLKVRRK